MERERDKVIHIYIYMCVCVCGVLARDIKGDREREKSRKE
jgi:hypothetical protein